MADREERGLRARQSALPIYACSADPTFGERSSMADPQSMARHMGRPTIRTIRCRAVTSNRLLVTGRTVARVLASSRELCRVRRTPAKTRRHRSALCSTRCSPETELSPESRTRRGGPAPSLQAQGSPGPEYRTRMHFPCGDSKPRLLAIVVRRPTWRSMRLVPVARPRDGVAPRSLVLRILAPRSASALARTLFHPGASTPTLRCP